MTVYSDHSAVRSVADGTQVEFPFDFDFDTNDTIVVTVGGIVASSLTYSVDIDTEDDGGTVTFDDPPAASSVVEIARIMPLTQTTEYPVAGPFSPQSHERALDKLTKIVQQQQRYIEEGVSYPPLAGEWFEGKELLRYQIVSDPDTSNLYIVATDYTAGESIAVDVAAGNLTLAADIETAANAAETATTQAGLASDSASAAAGSASGAFSSYQNTVAWAESAEHAKDLAITAQGLAEDARDEAVASAALIDLPVPTSNDFRKVVQVVDANPTEWGLVNIHGKNLLRNALGRINQRGVSGTVSLAAGEYGHDGWYAGSTGCLYSFSDSGNGKLFAILSPTDSLLQKVEGANVHSGTVVLSWEGTCYARINGGTWGPSGSVTAEVTGGSDIIVEFAGAGTFERPQLEYGDIPTIFEPISIRQDLAECQRYLQKHVVHLMGFATGAGQYLGQAVLYPVTMRSIPAVTFTYSGATAVNTGTIVVQHFPTGNSALRAYCQSSGASSIVEVTLVVTLNAELT